jgi:hypothetical protein
MSAFEAMPADGMFGCTLQKSDFGTSRWAAQLPCYRTISEDPNLAKRRTLTLMRIPMASP